MDPLIGQTLGRYQVLSRLGTGGMASVYQGFDPALSRYVAIKVGAGLDPSAASASERFAFEARSLAAFSHPNIVPIYDYGQQDDLVYLVMEYIPGGTLAQLIEAGPLPVHEAVQWLLPVARALEYAHNNQIVHRDVKPANILLRGGQPVLTDFGISRLYRSTAAASSDTIPVDTAGGGQQTRTFGTPTYMSPEQCQGLSADRRSDIYSLGVVLFELIAGVPPFRGDNAWGVCVQHASAAPPRLGDARPEAGGPALDAVQAVLDRALAKDPGERYPGMPEMIRELEAVLQAPAAGAAYRQSVWNEPPPARPAPWPDATAMPAPPVRPAPPARPNRLFFILGGLLAACLLLSVAAALVFGPGLLERFPAAGSPAAGIPAAGTPAAGTPAAGSPAAGTPAAGLPATATAAAPVETAAPTAAETAPPAETPPPAEPPAGPPGSAREQEAAVEAFIASYFENINARNYDTTWRMLSDNFKQTGQGRDDFDAYVRWWNGFERVAVRSVDAQTVNAERRIVNATVTLRYFRPDRDPQTETYTYRVVYTPGIGWQIDL